MNTVAYYAEVAAGSAIGSLNDPLTWLMIAIVAAFARLPWWVPLAVALLKTAVQVAIVWNWWGEIGIRSRWLSHAVTIALASVLISDITYGIARATRSIVGRLR